MAKEKTKVVLVDDHTLFRKGMTELINNFDNYTVVWEASNGKEFIKSISICPTPEIVLLDVAMPEMDGFETAAWIKLKYPNIKILILSMLDSEETIIKMLKIKVNGYILKDIEPNELKIALDDTMQKGFYYTDLVSGTMAKSINVELIPDTSISLRDREIEFIRLCCTDYTYKEISDLLRVSLRTVDGYRESVFTKLKIKSRISLLLYAMKNNYFKL